MYETQILPTLTLLFFGALCVVFWLAMIIRVKNKIINEMQAHGTFRINKLIAEKHDLEERNKKLGVILHRQANQGKSLSKKEVKELSQAVQTSPLDHVG